MPSSRDPDAIEISVTLPGTIEEVWHLLVDPEHVRQWFGDHVTLEARPGGSFREAWSDGARPVVTTGRVVEYNPPTEIAWTWADDDWPCETRLTLRLEPSEMKGAATLRLTHAGWALLETKSGHRLRSAHESGWQRHLASLKNHAERVAGGKP